MTTPGQWDAARRVLAVRLDGMGDLVMTSPAIRALAGSGGRREVTVLTSPAAAECAQLLPGVTQVLTYEAPWMKATPAGHPATDDQACAEALRAGRFDAAVIFTVFSQNPLPAAFLCHLAGIPLRLAHCRENPYQLLTDWVEEPERTAASRHETRRQLDLVATRGWAPDDDRLQIGVPEAGRRAVAARLQALPPGLGAGPLVVVHPGASAPSRRYPATGFAAAADLVHDRLGARILVTGGAEEAAVVAAMVGAMRAPAAPLAGCLSVGELAALIAAADLLVANNSGPVHLAAAVGTPVVDLYALTNPQHTPWGVPHRVLSHDVACRWCYKSICPESHHACLRQVDAAEVAAAAVELLARTGRAMGPPRVAPVVS